MDKADECPEYAPKGSETCLLNVCCSKFGYLPAMLTWNCRPITDIVVDFAELRPSSVAMAARMDVTR